MYNESIKSNIQLLYYMHIPRVCVNYAANAETVDPCQEKINTCFG